MARGTVRLLLFVFLAPLLIIANPVAAQEPVGLVRSYPADLESHDGVVLSTRIFYLDNGDDDARPLVITAHGWGGSKEDRSTHAAELARRGYTVITYDARGFGQSGGTVGLNGPAEVADVTALIDFALGFGTRDRLERIPPVATDDDGDPLVGMTGESYGGAVQLLAAAQDHRIDAIVPEITWSDLGDALAPNGVVNRGWADVLFFFGLMSSHGATSASPDTGGLDERLARWYADAYATGRLSDEAQAALAERSPLHVLDRIEADVLLVQGYRDTLFVPDQALTNYDGLVGRADSDTHLMFHNAGHGFSRSLGEREEVMHATNDFLDRHLRGETVVKLLPPVTYWVPAESRWASAAAWPAAFAKQVFPLTHNTTTVTLHQVAAPTSHTQTPNFQERAPTPTQDAPVPSSVLLRTGIQGPYDWVGSPTVNLTIKPTVDDLTLFVSLVDQDRVVAGQVTPVRIEGKAGEEVTLEVPIRAGAHRVAEGRTLFVRVTTSDSAYLGGREAGQVVLDLATARLSLTSGLDADAWLPQLPAPLENEKKAEAPAPGIALTALAALGAGAWARRHGRT